MALWNKFTTNKLIAIVGNGGFGKEVYWHLVHDGIRSENITFFVDDEYYDESQLFTKKLSDLIEHINEYDVFVALGNPDNRKKVVERLPNNTQFGTFVHNSVAILDPNIKIGEGSIICAGSILTTNITLGKHAHLNLNTTIGHDTIVGDYFTTAPGVHISGNVKIGNNVYFGTNSACREKINIVDNSVIGLNGGVVKTISESGIYVGVPVVKK